MKYTAGDNAEPLDGYPTIPVDDMTAGKWILEYHIPSVVFSLFSASQIESIVRAWVFTKNEYILSSGGGLLNILGITIDTDAGSVWVKVQVSPVPNPSEGINQAGISPQAVVAIGGTLFAVLAVVGWSLMHVYKIVDRAGDILIPGSSVERGTSGASIFEKVGYTGVGIAFGVSILFIWLVFRSAKVA